MSDETVNIMRYTETPGFEGEVEWRIDPKGDWVRFEDVWPELRQLREALRAYKNCRHACQNCFCTKEARAVLCP